MSGDAEYDLVDISNTVEGLEAQDDDDDDDDHKKERREFFKKLAQAVLLYHVVPERAFTSSELAVNTTFATKLSLPDDSFKGEPLRVRVAATPPFKTLVVNFYAKVIKSNVYASNGMLYTVDVRDHSELTSFINLQELCMSSTTHCSHLPPSSKSYSNFPPRSLSP